MNGGDSQIYLVSACLVTLISLESLQKHNNKYQKDSLLSIWEIKNKWR